MSVSEASWQEAGAFIRGLGFPGDVLENPAFRKDAELFLTLLLKKNEELNLTGAKDLETLFWKHLVDSLCLLTVPNLGITVDWGCGGGFPGVPLALARKHCSDSTPVFFLDSVGKKVRAVEEFCSALGLVHFRGFVGRGEAFIKDGSLGQVNTAVMRAVAPPERAIDWMSKAVPQWIFFLGPNQLQLWKQQRSALARRGLEISSEARFSLPRDLGERVLLRISKCST